MTATCTPPLDWPAAVVLAVGTVAMCVFLCICVIAVAYAQGPKS